MFKPEANVPRYAPGGGEFLYCPALSGHEEVAGTVEGQTVELVARDRREGTLVAPADEYPSTVPLL